MIIEKKIVGFKVVNSAISEPPPKTPVKPDIIIDPREPILTGKTTELKGLPNKLFITINDITTEDNITRPYEIFINGAIPEEYMWVTAITRVLSALWRIRSDSTFIVDELLNVYDPKGGRFYKGKYYNSIVSEIAQVIKNHISELKTNHPEIGLTK